MIAAFMPNPFRLCSMHLRFYNLLFIDHLLFTNIQIWKIIYSACYTALLIFFFEFVDIFKGQFFKKCLLYRLLSTQKWVSFFSLNSVKNTILQRAWNSIFSISYKNEISETQFQHFFHFDGVLPMVILHKKKSGYMRWYLFFFCDIWTFFCQIKLRLIIVKKKVQISKKKSRYHFFFLTSAPYFGIKRGYHIF